MKKALLTLALLCGAATTPALAQTTATPATAPATTQPATAQPATDQPTDQPAAPAGDPDAVVGKVGRESFTLAEFDKAFRLAAARVVNAQGVPFEDSYLAEFAEARPEFLKQYLRDRAIYQLARVSNKPDAAALDDQMKQARADFETDEAFADALSSTGYASAEDLRAELERQLVVDAYLKGIQSRFKFSDGVVNGYYNVNKNKFAREAEACVKHILVPAQADAQAIAKDLAGGADFAKLAQDKSQDPGSAAQGGDLGCFGQGQMVESFDKASFSGPLNQVQTVQSQFGWHVLVVTKRTAAGTVPLAEAAPVIREQLSRDAAQKYLNTQIARVSTESFPDVVKSVSPSK